MEQGLALVVRRFANPEIKKTERQLPISLLDTQHTPQKNIGNFLKKQKRARWSWNNII
jgi:hypothetical protein